MSGKAAANENTFFLGTVAEFREVSDAKRREILSRVPDYTSDSGSSYFYADDGVYRLSNHWGAHVASCDWFLDGYSKGDASSFEYWYGDASRLGFAEWGSFKLKDDAFLVDETRGIFDRVIGPSEASMADITRGFITREGKRYEAEWDASIRLWSFVYRG